MSRLNITGGNGDTDSSGLELNNSEVLNFPVPFISPAT